MNAERQIVGSLLLDPSSIDEMQLINSEMFTSPVLGQIFSIFEHPGDEEINPIMIASKLQSDFMTEEQANGVLAEIVSKHDPGVSDKYCIDLIYDSFRARKLDEHLNHIRPDSKNIDNVMDDLREYFDSLQKPAEIDSGMTLSEMAKKFKDNYFKDKKRKQIKLGFAKIDNAISGMDDGDVIVIAARPAVGKSAFALQIIRKFGKDGFKVGYFNLEMAEKQVYERALASASGIDMSRIRLATTFLGDEHQKFDDGNRQLEKEDNVTTIPGTKTINDIRLIQKKKKFDIIVIDYLQLIKTTGKRPNRSSEVGDISRGLKAIATDFKIPVIALSQLNRASEMNKDKEPTMSELRESGDIEQDASTILLMWNGSPENPTEKKIKVEKSRNGHLDRETLYFDGKHMTFSTVDTSQKTDTQSDLPWN